MSVVQINPQDAFQLLVKNEKSVLVDVRTFEEFQFVGVVDSADFGDRMILLPWQILPQMDVNPQFDEKLEDILKKLFGNAIEEINLFFICKSGGRSNMAANYAKNLGYKNCYNIAYGFEGDLNQYYHRGQLNGWKAQNLPWRQN